MHPTHGLTPLAYVTHCLPLGYQGNDALRPFRDGPLVRRIALNPLAKFGQGSDYTGRKRG
ncbi:hypothetical protein JOE25_000809 [Serratia sp. PL17]|nr:hypothetical protein [Serratia sp. PL17]